MYVPRLLYEVLPFLYIVLAVLGIYTPEIYGRFCGILLIATSVWIIKKRRNYRKQPWNKQ